MIQRPNAVGLLLCQQAIVEEHTRNLTLVNTFRHLVLDSFPSESRQITIHALLTDGLGPMTLNLIVSRLDTMDEIYQKTGRVTFTNPLQERFLLIQTSRLSFPGPGRYEFRLLADGESIAQCVLEVLQRRNEHG